MDGQIESFGAPETIESDLCIVGSCSEPAVAEVDACFFCVDHFLSVSFQELQSRYERVRAKASDVAATNAFREFSSAWTRQAELLVKNLHVANEQTANQKTKARLLDALLWCSQAAKSLRRSPRTATAVPVWLRREDSRRTWEEDTWTSSVSRHGAAFVCRHPVDMGGTVVLVRKGKGGRASARVVYCLMDSEGQRQIGVELIDRDDFWD